MELREAEKAEQNIKEKRGDEAEKQRSVTFVREMEKSVSGSNRQMHDSVSCPDGREDIHPLTAASRPDEV